MQVEKMPTNFILFGMILQKPVAPLAHALLPLAILTIKVGHQEKREHSEAKARIPTTFSPARLPLSLGSYEKKIYGVKSLKSMNLFGGEAGDSCHLLWDVERLQNTKRIWGQIALAFIVKTWLWQN